MTRVRVCAAPASVFLLLFMMADLSACERRSAAIDGGASPRVIAAPPLPQGGAEPPQINLLNARRFGVQVFASQHKALAQSTLTAFQRQGLSGALLKADLGARGLWWRVVLGSFGSKRLAEVAARRWVLDLDLKKMWPPVPAGEALYLIRGDLHARQISPRAAFSIASTVGSHRYQAALLQPSEGSLRWVLLAVQGDARLRPIDASGALLQPLPVPAYPGCSGCVRLASSSRPSSVALDLVENLDGARGDEVLARYRYKDFELGSLLGWKQGRLVEFAGFVLANHQQTTLIESRLLPVEVDGDPGLELLHVTLEAVVHEGDLCDLRQEIRLSDLGFNAIKPRWTLPPIGSLGALTGDTQRFFWNLAATIEHEPSAAPLIVTLAWLVAQRQLVADSAAQMEFGRRLEQLKGAQAWRWRIEALAQLVSIRSSFSVTLVLAVLQSLQAALNDSSIGVNTLGCDERPLARSGTWSPADLARLSAKAPSRRDLQNLSLRAWQGLTSRYAAATPVGETLQKLADKLRPARARWEQVAEAMRRGRNKSKGLAQ